MGSAILPMSYKKDARLIWVKTYPSHPEASVDGDSFVVGSLFVELPL